LAYRILDLDLADCLSGGLNGKKKFRCRRRRRRRRRDVAAAAHAKCSAARKQVSAAFGAKPRREADAFLSLFHLLQAVHPSSNRSIDRSSGSYKKTNNTKNKIKTKVQRKSKKQKTLCVSEQNKQQTLVANRKHKKKIEKKIHKRNGKNRLQNG